MLLVTRGVFLIVVESSDRRSHPAIVLLNHATVLPRSIVRRFGCPFRIKSTWLLSKQLGSSLVGHFLLRIRHHCLNTPPSIFRAVPIH
uniref:Secreted protein n=1 Tax=Romanomermis culicivorax TaxID=13658 RepID=A0A915JTH6_ROMCU